MNIAVLAGGISTEREVSIVSGTGVCKALREKGHRAILIDVFCGDERIDITDKEEVFPAQYDVDASAAYMRSMNGSIEAAKASGANFSDERTCCLQDGGCGIPCTARCRR